MLLCYLYSFYIN